MDSQPVSLASVAAKKAVDKPNISLSALSTMITSWDGITVGIMAVWMCPISDHPNERGSNQNLLHKMKIKIGILLSEAQTQNTVSIFLVGIFIQTNNGFQSPHQSHFWSGWQSEVLGHWKHICSFKQHTSKKSVMFAFSRSPSYLWDTNQKKLLFFLKGFTHDAETKISFRFKDSSLATQTSHTSHTNFLQQSINVSNRTRHDSYP